MIDTVWIKWNIKNIILWMSKSLFHIGLIINLKNSEKIVKVFWPFSYFMYFWKNMTCVIIKLTKKVTDNDNPVYKKQNKMENIWFI